MKVAMRYVGLIAALCTAGCYASHTRPAGAADSGLDSGHARRDASDARTDAGSVDTGLWSDADAAIDCGHVAGFRRCDEACPLPCEGPDGRCHDWIGVCRPRHPSGRDDDCSFSPIGGPYVFTGNPCAIRTGTGTSDGDAWVGIGMPVEFCLAAPDAGLPEFTCLYSDGTPLVTGPPPADCPPSDPINPFCGGSCGTAVECPFGPGRPASCIGLSDTRSHGVCMVDPAYCRADAVGTFWQGRILEVCAEKVEGECACMVPRPQAFPETEVGFPMLRSACAAYRARFPDSVVCVDAEWAELP